MLRHETGRTPTEGVAIIGFQEHAFPLGTAHLAIRNERYRLVANGDTPFRNRFPTYSYSYGNPFEVLKESRGMNVPYSEIIHIGYCLDVETTRGEGEDVVWWAVNLPSRQMPQRRCATSGGNSTGSAKRSPRVTISVLSSGDTSDPETPLCVRIA